MPVARFLSGPKARRNSMRTNWLKTSLALAVILVGVLASTPAGAESFADVAIGTAVTHNGDVNSTEDVEFNESFTISGRVGNWFEPGRGQLNFGWGVNLFRFEPDITSQRAGSATLSDFTEIDVTAVSLDILLKIPYRMGRLRPYATAGPAIFFFTIKNEGSNFGGGSASDYAFGLKFGLGFYYPFRPRLDLFGEYRYTQFSIDAETTVTGGRTEMDMTTSHFVVGLAYRY
jgi:opacity protein-like surface antigen